MKLIVKPNVHVYSLTDHLSSPETHFSLTSVTSQSCTFIQETESYIKKVSPVLFFSCNCCFVQCAFSVFFHVFVVAFFYPIWQDKIFRKGHEGSSNLKSPIELQPYNLWWHPLIRPIVYTKLIPARTQFQWKKKEWPWFFCKKVSTLY